MIIWLSSYPKSGNTLMRSFLSSYFFSKDGIFNFELLKNIKQYPNDDLFAQLGVNIADPHEVAKSHIRVQEFINKDKKSFKFLKTHSSFVKMDGFSFTDLANTLGVIHIVRDPRDVAVSFAHHNNQSIEKTAEMINKDFFLHDADLKDKIPTYMGSWSLNYNSWNTFNKTGKYLLIKFEDLIKDRKKNFKKILNFIKVLTKSNFEINDKKIDVILQEIEFEKLKKLEEKEGFNEARTDDKGNKIKFFREGKSNSWKKTLDPIIKTSIEAVCQKEMKELGYL
jgi:hypothetical protein